MLKNLQNGSDIRGIAVEAEGRPINLTEEACVKIGRGFAAWLGEKTDRDTPFRIAVGVDSRISGPALKEALIASLAECGCQVLDCGMATTPAMFMACVFEEYRCDGAVMITASHLPFYYNGLKFFTGQGGCESSDIRRILELADEEYAIGEAGQVAKASLIDDYAGYLVEMIRKGIDSKTKADRPLEGMKIILDAGNGAGGFFAEKVLAPLGADTRGSQFLEPDGTFPNHIPNPENKEAMESICGAVLKNGGDLGIIFDTDVDRAALVGSSGEEINRNALIALISAIILEEEPGGTIVTDSVTSFGLAEFITNAGGRHHRFKRGYRNVINEAIRLNEEGIPSPLAIETSGHAAMKENYFLDDGAYLIAKILIKAAKLGEEGKSLESLIAGLKQPAESYGYRLTIDQEDFKSYGLQVLEDFPAFVESTAGWSLEPQNYEGVRVNCGKDAGNGWILLRMSLHEPVMPLDMESDSVGGTEKMMDRMEEFLSRYTHLRR